MGVTGLWTVVAPTARPTKLETLNRKRLAVDASIWIYQFLKAVRDKEGNALRNSHVVGFFRRICKLLYFGIQPVFVFDGGAPVLKRETVRSRARRREGRREDAVRTAGKLLAVQVARAAEDEEKRRQQARERTPAEEEVADEELVYVDEVGMSQKERQATRGFKKKDQYHLPNLDVSMESLGAPNDPRIMSQAELEEYARQFHSGEDINLYDFSKIDFESPFFLSLPPGDRYNILNAARLRSRLRMGYSKEQLDGMFPDRMAFSKFQIERVKERNELTQRLMHINGMSEDSWNQGGRIVGEKGKEYVLVKNDGVEGGWALGVVSNKAGSKREDAIDLEDEANSEGMKADSDEDEFEDIAVEGLNRLPTSLRKPRKELREVDYDISYEDAAAQIARKRQAVYAARQRAAAEATPASASARVEAPEAVEKVSESLFVPDEGDSPDSNVVFEDVDIPISQDEDDDLSRAIAMSLEQPNDEMVVGNGLNEQHTIDDEDGFDLRAALAESRKSKYQGQTEARSRSRSPVVSKFDGPLPFESLNLGQSLLGKKKAKKMDESLSGGFEREDAGPKPQKTKPAQALPSWFESTPAGSDSRRWNEPELDNHSSKVGNDIVPKNRRNDQKVVIDLEADDQDNNSTRRASDDESRDVLYEPVEEHVAVSGENGDLSPPADGGDYVQGGEREEKEKEEAAKDREARYELGRQIAAEQEAEDHSSPVPTPLNTISEKPDRSQLLEFSAVTDFDKDNSENAEDIEWSESDAESEPGAPNVVSSVAEYSDRNRSPSSAEGDNDLFEDVEMEDNSLHRVLNTSASPTRDHQEDYLVTAPGNEEYSATNEQNDLDGYLSDSDEELMRQLAVEAEEHARFAAELNSSKSTAEARRDYENELKQLRSQQKRDRRDADEVTQVMIQECQALLGLFGLPYITAPMEAEAQCAELVHLELVDGIVTDDSDIFLFGGTRIYKNMFNAAKFVECYLASDLEKEYALDRRKLIRFAHLLGSDYTEGIPGIGPVTALEIISDFGTLEEFKEWCSKVQLGRPQDLEAQLTSPFRRKFKRTVQKKLFLPTGFPDVRVDQAYLKPEVDSDPQEFKWGVPDLERLRSFLMATIGWSQERTDEILLPVVRDINRREQEGTQANITQFFAGGVGAGASNEGTAPRNRTGKESGRMKNAYTRLRGEAKKRQTDRDFDQSGNEGVTSEVESGAETASANELNSVDAPSSPAKSRRKTKKRKTKA